MARLRHVVIVLPGITGSVLQKDGRDVWAATPHAVGAALSSIGQSLQRLEMTSADDPDLEDLGDGITAPRLVDDLVLIPGFKKLVYGYTRIRKMIADRFTIETGGALGARPGNYYEFPYDWRRDNRVAARKLKQLIDWSLPAWRLYSGAADAKVILLAHSMGGLISRYYLKVLDGWENCLALITLGTPFRGAVKALNALANGNRASSIDMTRPLRSFPAMYQLLPIYRAVRTDSGYQRPAQATNLPNIDRRRAREALLFHRLIECAVQRHRRQSRYLEQGYKLIPFVGTKQPTLQSARLRDGGLVAGPELPDGVDEYLADGDGTVPRLSAIPIEMSTEYRDSFFAQTHGAIQASPVVLADVIGRLEQMQVRGLKALRDVQTGVEAEAAPAISLDMKDVYAAGEPVTASVQVINPREPDSAAAPVARIESASTSSTVRNEKLIWNGGHWLMQAPSLAPGLYRISVRTPQPWPLGPATVDDAFAVSE